MAVIPPKAFLRYQVAVLALAGLLIACSADESQVEILPGACAKAPTRTCLQQHAIKVARAIRDVEERDKAFSDIAERQTDAKNFEGAAKTTALIKSDQLRMLTLAYVTSAKSASPSSEILTTEQLARALERARGHRGPQDRAKALQEIAKQQYEQGLAADARATIEEATAAAQVIEGSNERGYELTMIARQLIGQQQMAGALTTLEKARAAAQAINDEALRAAKLGWVASAQAAAGDMTAALATVRMASQTRWEVATLLKTSPGSRPREA